MKRTVIFVLIFLFSLNLVSQDKTDKDNKFFVSVDALVGSVNGDLRSKWPVRQFIESYDNYTYNGLQLSTLSIRSGVTAEYRFLKNQLGIISGLRYTYVDSELSSYKRYFHLRYRMEGVNTEYARVRSIIERSNFIGIPVELRYIPLQNETISLYFKIGTEFNFKVGSDIDINFENEHMEDKQQEIFDNIGIETDSFYSSLYCAVGMRLGKESGVHVNGELLLPSYVYTSNNFSLMSANSYFGFQLSLVVPIKSK